MPDERGSPSGGWREVYAAMAVSTRVESAGAECPDCGSDSPSVGTGRYWCPAHGTFAVAG